MAEGVLERLGQLEHAVRRAAEILARLREENDRLKREVAKLTDDRKQILGQIDGMLEEIAKLEGH